MAFREVTVLEVLRLWRDGVSKKRNAAQLGLDVKTARRYLKQLERASLESGTDLDVATAAVAERLEVAHGRPRGEGWERCEEHREFIRTKLAEHVRLTERNVSNDSETGPGCILRAAGSRSPSSAWAPDRVRSP